MAIADNATYKIYALNTVLDVPTEKLKILVTVFIDYAARNLGCKVDKADVDQIIEFIQSPEFCFLPVSVVASAFSRGSLGKLKNDKLTLNPRNIYDWMTEVKIEHRNNIEHNEREKRLSADVSHFKELKKYPLGQALCKKIDWYNSGAIDSDDWDRIPLRDLSEVISRGGWPSPNDFGIQAK